jgi:hypothetical protein
LQDELKRVRASQREQQAAAAREAELLSADPFDLEILPTRLWSPLGLLLFPVFAGVAEAEAYH